MKKIDSIGIALLICAFVISATLIYQAYKIKQRNKEAEETIQYFNKMYDSLLKAREFKNV